MTIETFPRGTYYERLFKQNQRLIKILDNVANCIQRQNKDMPLDDFVERWNTIATEGLDDVDWVESEQKDVLCIFNEYEDALARLEKENEELKKELKRCKDWINSDKNDYELTLSFIKHKGYSLKDVLEYEKELKK